MKKGILYFTLLICISLIGCTININTMGQIDAETSIQMTLTSVANQYFQNQNQPATIITITPHTPLQPQANSQQNAQPESQSITITDTPTITPTPIPCLQLGKVVDVTLPDGTQLQPGASEMKTWRLTNKGSCTWDQSYSLVYQSGNLPVRNPVVALSHSVQPGETIEVSVPIMVPQDPGTYTSNFLLRDGSGQTFGSGIGAITTFWVKVNVQKEFKVTDFGFGYDDIDLHPDSQGKCLAQIPYFINSNSSGTVKYRFQIERWKRADILCVENTEYSSTLEMNFNDLGTERLVFSTKLIKNCGYSIRIQILEPLPVQLSDNAHVFQAWCFE